MPYPFSSVKSVDLRRSPNLLQLLSIFPRLPRHTRYVRKSGRCDVLKVTHQPYVRVGLAARAVHSSRARDMRVEPIVKTPQPIRSMSGPRSKVGNVLLALVVLVGCRGADADHIPADERRKIASELEALVTNAYDFTKPDVGKRLLGLYADSGRVISAAAGRVITTHDALQAEIFRFWGRVGRNMRQPQFVLGSTYVDILTRDAAVMTFTYSIPHTTPQGTPHTVSGAWTTFWRREGGRWVIVQEHLSDTPESTAPGPSVPPR